MTVKSYLIIEKYFCFLFERVLEFMISGFSAATGQSRSTRDFAETRPIPCKTVIFCILCGEAGLHRWITDQFSEIRNICKQKNRINFHKNTSPKISEVCK
jgi:hypothetical protein